MRRVSGDRVVAEAAAGLPRTWGHRPLPPEGSVGIGNRAGCQGRSAILDCEASRGASVVEDAADDAAFGDEGDDPHHAPTAERDERVDSVHATQMGRRSGTAEDEHGGCGFRVVRNRSSDLLPRVLPGPPGLARSMQRSGVGRSQAGAGARAARTPSRTRRRPHAPEPAAEAAGFALRRITIDGGGRATPATPRPASGRNRRAWPGRRADRRHRRRAS